MQKQYPDFWSRLLTNKRNFIQHGQDSANSGAEDVCMYQRAEKQRAGSTWNFYLIFVTVGAATPACVYESNFCTSLCHFYHFLVCTWLCKWLILCPFQWETIPQASNTLFPCCCFLLLCFISLLLNLSCYVSLSSTTPLFLRHHILSKFVLLIVFTFSHWLAEYWVESQNLRLSEVWTN